MTIIQEINDISSVVISLTINTPSTEIKYVESRWTKKPKQYLKNLLNFSVKLNIFEINDNKISITEIGILLFEQCTIKNGKRFLEDTFEQRNFLKEIFWYTPQILNDFKKMINQFSEYNAKGDLKFVLTTNHNFDRFLLVYLQEIGILKLKQELNEVTGQPETILYCENSIDSISKLRNNVTELSEEELDEKIAENKEIGKKGEEKVLEIEKERLRKEGRIDLAMTIKQVSVTNAYAGYDIKSYKDKNSKLNEYDKLIEVKTTRSSSPRFFWSSNEVKVAESEGERYWIYLWTNWEREASRKLERIQNPYKRLFTDNVEVPKCTGYFFDKI